LLQRNTQSPKYWQDFAVQPADTEQLFKLVLDGGRPQSTDSLALALIQHRLEREAMAMRTDLEGGTLYQPQGSFADGERLIFPRFDYATGVVVGRRPGHHPRYGDFVVISVDFGAPTGIREFAAEFSHPHSLNLGDGRGLADLEGDVSAADILNQYRDYIVPRLVEALEAHQDFVRFKDEWLLRGMLVPLHAGHLNIAEAAIDISDRPMPTASLLKDLDLPAEVAPSILEFSLNHTLDVDERFVNVGPKGQVSWYLKHMQPGDIHQVPRYLQLPDLPFDVRRLDDSLLQILAEVDDEATDPALLPTAATANDEVTIVLICPHRRAGTLPISARTASFFPQADDHHVRITFVDRLTGQQIPGWVVSEHRYVAGLSEWYIKNQLVTGAYVTLHRTDSPLTVEISYRQVRPKREWVRGVVAQGGHLSFQNLRLMVTCQYDELMIVGEDNPAAVDALWETHSERRPLLSLLRQLAFELIKINPQGTVHAKTLYSAVNVVRRCPPGPVFHEIVSNPCFVPMGHGYWTYDASRSS